MIQSLDPVGSGLRLDPLLMVGRGPVIDAEQARALGLRNGQVVQAVIDDSASAFSVLWPAGQRQGLPTALQAFPLPSQWRWAAGSSQELMATLMPGGHIMLRPVRPGAVASPSSATPAGAASRGPEASPGTAGASAAATAVGGSAFAAALTPGAPSSAAAPAPVPAPLSNLYTLGQAFALAQAAGSQGSSADVARLMQQAPAWAGLLRLLSALTSPDTKPGFGESADADVPTLRTPMNSRLADMLGTALPRMGSLTPEALRQAVGRSGLGTEAALLAGALGLDQDLKVALRRLMRTLPGGGTAAEGLLSGLPRAVDTLERSALDSLSAQMQGQLLLSLVIPFGDAGPVALRIARERARPDEEPPPFVVDVHSAHSGLGPLWLRTQVAHDQRVAITMWAARPEVADHARGRSQELRQSLHGSGLQLSSLEIVAGMPEPEHDVFPGTGDTT